MATILLIRHGVNDFVGKRLAGRTPGVHLNETGLKQAEQIAEVLRCAPLKAIFSSPLERAMETAAPLAAIHHLEVQPHPGLLEVDFGEWQGISFAAMHRKKLWKTVIAQPSAVCFPAGESFIAAQQRVITTINTLNTAFEEKDVVACFSHSDIIRLALAHFLATPLDAFQRIIIDTASISILHLRGVNIHVAAVNQLPFFAWVPQPTRKRKSS